MKIEKTCLRRLWPGASQAMIDAVVDYSESEFDDRGFNTSLRVAHFMAQISHESNGGTIKEENLTYTTAARIAAVWPSRFNADTAKPFVRNARALANRVYNGRMGNRPSTDDGWNYRGRGLLQLTGRVSYQRVGKAVGLDLENQPELAADPSNALAIAAEEFVSLGCLAYCDKDDVRGVTRRVNGGEIGLTSRMAWLAKWKAALPNMPGELPTTPQGIADMSGQMPRGGDVPATTPDPIDKWIERASVGGPVATGLLGQIKWEVAAVVAIASLILLGALFYYKRKWA